MIRIYSLDYLRGISAFLIMIYHFLSWTYGDFSSENTLGRFGLYGVSIFFILSGLTLYNVYYSTSQLNRINLSEFFIKRIFRILPLLILTTLTYILLFEKKADLSTVILNITGLFGYFEWDNYIATGAWSIGNEIVFYTIFPFFIFFLRKKKLFATLMYLLSFLTFIFFAFVLIKGNNFSDLEWTYYTNPFNQLFLFFSGIVIGHFLCDKKIHQTTIVVLLTITLLLFISIPVHGERINLIKGYNRIYFSFISIAITGLFFKLNSIKLNVLHSSLLKLGEMSYALYLIHPITWNIYIILKGKIIGENIYLPNYINLPLVCILSIFISHFVYILFEKKFIKIGRFIIDRLKLS